jgi:protein archease
MSSEFKNIDHTGDIAVEVTADSITELLKVSALAWKNSVLEENSEIDNKEIKKIKISERTLEELLVSFLSELNFLLQVEKWIFNEIDIIEVAEKDQWMLETTLLGELFDNNKHDLKTEIKAITFHQMNIEYINGIYKTKIVFDI